MSKLEFNDNAFYHKFDFCLGGDIATVIFNYIVGGFAFQTFFLGGAT